MSRLQFCNLVFVLLSLAWTPGTMYAWSAAPAELRQSTNFNRQWKFQLGDVSGGGHHVPMVGGV